jgi:uncharacterized membrane protein
MSGAARHVPASGCKTGSGKEIQTRIRKLAAAGVKQVAVAAGSQSAINEFTEHVIHALA